jgi:alpha-glucosidase
MRIRFIICILCSISIHVVLVMGCGGASETTLVSPNGRLKVNVTVVDGMPHYDLTYNGSALILPSSLGLHFDNLPDLGPMRIVETERSHVDETRQPVWGTKAEIRDNHYQLLVRLQEADPPSRRMDLVFRAYDDGMAFRYHLPEQDDLDLVEIAGEATHFIFADDYAGYALQLGKYTTGYEKEFDLVHLCELEPSSVVGLPLLVNAGRAWMAVTEANLTDFAGMYLSGSGVESPKLVSRLSPRPDDEAIKVKGAVPLVTPWRVVLVGDEPGYLVESNLIVNLNEPTKFEDVSWIEPGLVLWPWWNGRLPFGEPSTAQMKHYIDFASEQGIPYLLVDAGWYSLERDAWDEPDAEDILTMEESRESFYDIREVIDYAKQKSVGIHLWVHGDSLRRQIDEALPVYAEWGAVGIKVDSYGRDDQEWVQFVHEIAEKAAKHRLTVNYHGAYKSTGIRRTFPNIMTREGVLGLEHAKWSDVPTPRHDVTLPFTRMLAGPMDYTPGAFDLDGTDEAPKQVQGTRAHQLAMYVVYFSPLQMVSDYPEAYASALEEFDFIKRVPAVWDDTRVLEGMPGDFITMARRKGDTWYVGSMTNENPRRLELPLGFLDPGVEYVAVIFSDASDANENPESVEVTELGVDRDTVLKAELAGGGGCAVRIKPAN